jgi:hypothetical protein
MIENKSIGTYSDQNGKFDLPVNLDDKVIFSLIGYETKLISAKDLGGNIEIQLNKQTYNLPKIEVNITDARPKGKKGEYGFIRAKKEVYNGRPIGNQVAVFIAHPNKENVLLTQALFRLAIEDSEENKCGKVRVHLYAFDQYTRSPGEDLLKKEITRIICADKLIKVDLSEFKIAFPPEGIFVALEFLGETKIITYCNKFINNLRLGCTYTDQEEVNKLAPIIDDVVVVPQNFLALLNHGLN